MVELLSNSAHLHVLLNHVPTVGFGMGLGLFLIALIKDRDGLKRTSLVIFFLVANVAIATYVTGNAAESVLRGTGPEPAFGPGVLPAAIRAHEDAALVAFAFMEVTGFFSLLSLWHWRRVSRLAGWTVALVLILSVVTFALMARAADLGGDISHAEMRATQTTSEVPAASTEETGLARHIGLMVNGSTGDAWIWPTCETLHFVGLSMLFTVVLIVDLRLLGMMKSVSYAAVYQLLPIGMLGFGINLITGMLFFIGVPGQYVHNVTFFWKIVFVLLGGFNVLYFILDDAPWKVAAGDDAPITAKLAAASALVIWVAVLFCGHMLPFIGNAF